MDELYEKYISLLLQVNDESKTKMEHDLLSLRLTAWEEGVYDALKRRFNGDHYYTPLIDSGKMKDRPMCCGVFLDWEHKPTNRREERCIPTN